MQLCRVGTTPSWAGWIPGIVQADKKSGGAGVAPPTLTTPPQEPECEGCEGCERCLNYQMNRNPRRVVNGARMFAGRRNVDPVVRVIASEA